MGFELSVPCAHLEDHRLVSLTCLGEDILTLSKSRHVLKTTPPVLPKTYPFIPFG